MRVDEDQATNDITGNMDITNHDLTYANHQNQQCTLNNVFKRYQTGGAMDVNENDA